MHMAAARVGHFAADGEGLLKIRCHLPDRRAAVKLNGVFKVQIQTAKIHIDRSDDRVAVV